MVNRMLDLLSPPPPQRKQKKKILFCKRCKSRDDHHTAKCPKAWHKETNEEEDQTQDPPQTCSGGKEMKRDRDQDDDSEDDLLSPSPKPNSTSQLSDDLQQLIHI